MVYASKKPEPKSRSTSSTEKGWSGLYGISSVEIKENMVFSTNIDIYDPQWREDVGIMGPGETIWVSAKGPVRLIKMPTEFTTV